MTMKMKGVLKGLRYITQIFDNESEDEPEMQIGLPTDVKHVAHIGWEGPSTAPSPSWMNDFKSNDDSTQQSTTAPVNATSSTSEPTNKTKPSKRRTSKNVTDGTTQDSQSQDPSSIQKQSRKKKSSRGDGLSRGSSSVGSTRSRAKSDTTSSSSKNEESGTTAGSGSAKTRRKKERATLSCAGPGSNNDQLDTISTFKTLKLEENV